MSSPPTDSAASIARLSLHDPAHFNIQHSQTLHRLALLEHWNIAPGSKLLELGCGQGDCTTVLAHAVGEQGHVVALDPAPLDYGAPYTLGQAQSHITSSPLGPRITFIQSTTEAYLSSLSSAPATSPSPSPPFDAAVLAHSLFYHPTPSALRSTFLALRRHTPRLLLAEWSLSASTPAATPHVLAVLAQAALEARKTDSASNVRTVLAPKRMVELAGEAGWTLETAGRVVPGEGLADGGWEVGAVLAGGFEKEVEETVRDEVERGVVLALRDACEASLQGVEGGLKGVRCMDVWVASFV